MRIIRTNSFKHDFKKLSEEIKQRTQKALRLLIVDSYYPSLRVKKTKGKIIKEYNNIFEARITRDYRFLFLIENDSYILLRCGKHDEFF